MRTRKEICASRFYGVVFLVLPDRMPESHHCFQESRLLEGQAPSRTPAFNQAEIDKASNTQEFAQSQSTVSSTLCWIVKCGTQPVLRILLVSR